MLSLLPFFFSSSPWVPGTCWRLLDCPSVFSLSLSLSDAPIMEGVCWQQISIHISFPVKFLGLCDKAVSCEVGGGRGQHVCEISALAVEGAWWASPEGIVGSGCWWAWKRSAGALEFTRKMLVLLKLTRTGCYMLVVQIVLSNPVNHELMKNSSGKKSWYNYSVACDMTIRFSALSMWCWN